jgi:ParB family chromosome partitioning protein
MHFKIETVKLANIDCTDNTYRITTATNIDDLTASIKKIGLLNPPLLLENNSEYMIVCGFRRIEACRILGWSQVKARILDPGTQKADCAKIAVTDNALQRPLNLIEQSKSLALISGFIRDNVVLARELSTLGLPENQSVIKKIKEICHLSRPIQRAILSDIISLAMALELGKLAPDVGAGFVELFENLKLSLNKQREIVTFVQEIALREEITILEILNENRLQAILNQTDLDKNQKTRIIRFYLKQRRFPAITSAERAFEKLIKALRLPRGIKLIPPANFEGSIYTLTFNFKELSELIEHKTTFDEITHNPYIKKILGQEQRAKSKPSKNPPRKGKIA